MASFRGQRRSRTNQKDKCGPKNKALLTIGGGGQGFLYGAYAEVTCAGEEKDAVIFLVWAWPLLKDPREVHWWEIPASGA